jgi:hypothetical protein
MQAAIAKARFLSCVSYKNSIEYCQAELLYYIGDRPSAV